MRGHDPRAENLNDDWIAKTQLLVPTSSHQILRLKVQPHSDRLHVQLASLPLYNTSYEVGGGSALENGPPPIPAGSSKARLIASSVLSADPDRLPPSWETGPLVQHHNLRYSCRSNICSFGRPAHFSMCMGCPETCFLALNKSEYCFSCLGVIALCGYGAKWEVRFIVYSLQNRYMIHGKVCIVLPRLLPHYV